MMPDAAQIFLDRILEPVGRCFTAEGAKRLLELRADPTVQERVDELADKSTAGTLSPEERTEYEAYIAAGTFIAVLQSKARTMLASQTAA
jgi:hypothetical protein